MATTGTTPWRDHPRLTLMMVRQTQRVLINRTKDLTW